MSKKLKGFRDVLNREQVIEAVNSSKDLSNYDLSRIDLGDLDFSGCNFSDSRLDFGWFKRSIFDNCNLQNCTFRYAMLDKTSFVNVNGINSCFNVSKIKDSNFSNSDFSFGAFLGSSLRNVNFRLSTFYRSQFIGAFLHSCRFDYSKMNKSKIFRALIKSCVFKNAELEESSFEASDIFGTNFYNVNLNNANFNRSKISHCIYKPEIFKTVSLINSDTMDARILIKIFISHASEDKPFAKKLSTDLKDNGFEVWLDEWEIRVGDSITEKIESGLKKADYLIVVLSDNFIKKNWPMRELRASIMKQASSGKKFILPVKIDDQPMPELLSDILYADFRTDYNSGLDKLVFSISQDSIR